MEPRSWIRHRKHPAKDAKDWVAWVELEPGRLLALAFDGEHRVAEGDLAKRLLKDIEVSKTWVRV